MADTSRSRFSPFGISLFAVAIIVIVIAAFLMLQRGGEVTGDVGADGINPEPEQIEVEEVEEINDEAIGGDDDLLIPAE